MATAQEVIVQALKKLGVVSFAESPPADQLTDGLDTLNNMLDSWGGDSLLNLSGIIDTITLVSGTNSYTIGSSQTVDTVKPLSITSAYISDGNNDYPVAIITKETFDGKIDKTSSGRPTGLYYAPGNSQQTTQTGTIYLYYTPDAAYTLTITSEKNFTEFSALTSNIDLMPGYKKALIYNLAIDLADEYGMAPSNNILRQAEDSLDLIRAINVRNKKEIVSLNLPGSLSQSNITAGV